jgi:hypothetical protein
MSTEDPPSTFQPRAAAYSLEIEHPQTGATTCESYGTLLAVVARAAELIRAGNAIGIWAAASLEPTAATPVAANDDARMGALLEKLDH